MASEVNKRVRELQRIKKFMSTNYKKKKEEALLSHGIEMELVESGLVSVPTTKIERNNLKKEVKRIITANYRKKEDVAK